MSTEKLGKFQLCSFYVLTLSNQLGKFRLPAQLKNALQPRNFSRKNILARFSQSKHKSTSSATTNDAPRLQHCCNIIARSNCTFCELCADSATCQIHICFENHHIATFLCFLLFGIPQANSLKTVLLLIAPNSNLPIPQQRLRNPE